MEESESLDSEMTELQELTSDTISQDDEDEVEELHNSLRKAVQDQSVKPKLQCLMVDPSFSMVTVQSEDSGIVWETASSRCSTPWASEASSTSEAYSMEGSGGAGKITIVFDEEKVVRRRTMSGSRSSRLGDRLSRPGSSRSASALGAERPEMAEVSLPNVQQEKTKTEADLEEIKTKDQQLFSLISEGYEILNIRVPSKLPTVDEEEATELQDNLSYLDQTPKIRCRNHSGWIEHEAHDQPEGEDIHTEASKQDTSQLSEDKESGNRPTQTENTTDIDYFEKFTLLDVVAPGDQASELPEEELQQPPTNTQTEERRPVKEVTTDSPSVSEDSFVVVTDVEIVGEHLDEVFYGEGPPNDALQQREEEVGEARTRTRRESQRSTKESGSMLFSCEETTLTPIFLSSGPPKIIDPILLEEPTAMSFMYSDLYEDAVGERRRSDEEYSEAESVVLEKACKRRFSDSEEEDGYLEKFILKDETQAVYVQPESVDDISEGRMVWPQAKFEMTGSLIRVVQEEEEKERTKTEEAKMQESSAGGGLLSGRRDEKRELVSKTEEAQEQAVRQTSGDPSQKPKSTKEQMENQQVQHEVKTDQTELLETKTDKLLKPHQMEIKAEKREERQREDEIISAGTEQPFQAHKVAEEIPVTKDVTAPVSRQEVPPTGTESGNQTENTEMSSSKEAAADSKMVDQKLVTQAETEASAQVTTPEKETFSSREPLTETKTSTETTLSEKKEAAPEYVPEAVTDCDCELQTVAEVTGKTANKEEMQTQVKIHLQDVAEAQTAAPEGEKQQESLREEGAAEIQTKYAAADLESEVKTEILGDVIQPATPEEVKTETEEKHQQHTENEQQQIVIEGQSNEAKPTPETSSKMPAGDTGTSGQDVMNVGDKFVVLVPKGQAVEMDIEVGKWTERIREDTLAPPEPDHTQEAPEPQTEEEPKALEEELSSSDLDKEDSPLAPVEEDNTEEQKTEGALEEDNIVFSPLRSFPPQEDLSGLHDIQSERVDEEQKADIQETEDVPDKHIPREDAVPCVDECSEDVGQNKEQDKTILDAPDETVDQLGYEMISEQDARDMPESKPWREAVEFGLQPEERTETQTETDKEPREEAFGEDELIEEDYEIIDAEEESQARLAAELQGLDWFCSTCERLLSEVEYMSGEHHSHQVELVEKAYEEVKETLSVWISELQERSEIIEDLVSELELAYNSVEDQFEDSVAAMRAQNEEMMALVMEQYNQMSVTMEEEKKAKLEQLYDKIVSFQENIDSAKSTLETTTREAETDARSPEDICARLKAALDSASTLELGSKGLLVFEDYTKTNASSSNMAQRKGIPVPQRPTLQPQEPGSATSTSVTAYWKVNPGDIIDCFQVYCMEDPQGAVSEEYRVTVKESYCVLEELEPDKVYKVWVMGVNYTGCSLPSEKLLFRTAPSVPVIDTERCTVLWDSATLRWSSARQTPGQSYTLEYCRQYELEGEGLRSISGIKACEQRVLLQPNENYLFYMKAVNEAGVSEQSEAALISTRGTRFHLLKASAHPALKLSDDQSTLHYSQDAQRTTEKECPSILGELLPPRGLHYWETVVSGSPAYRLGVTCTAANRSSSLGENSTSWCLQCTSTPSGCRFQLLHGDIQSTVFVTETPERVGVLLDHQLGRLSFYNPLRGQLLGTFRERFGQPCHPVLALEQPGSLQVCTVPEVPEFTKDT
ncbi:cardiomyopathy-associated protein 5 [Kryptolebias marmoratus]|uniref:cardiomyopathy-associated protein 5 n=1 Tax=Kryptolebias marmoratus TaxID=37003 RepID=UPI0007F918AA|nr:cardiomyopathy-associated protein 5 [Kryptolebias marmoratus]